MSSRSEDKVDEVDYDQAPCSIQEPNEEQKMADCSSSSNSPISSPASSSTSPAPKLDSAVTGAAEITKPQQDYAASGAAPQVHWQPGWNDLVVEPDGEYCLMGDFSNGTMVVDGDGATMEPCYMAQATNVTPLMPPRFVPRPATVHVHNHPVCMGSGGALHHPPGTHSPHMHSPSAHSSGSSATPFDNGTSPVQQQYVVNVHVNHGETFSVRVGDEVQLIQGPATVRMVSNSGPPMPMPMQVPPGHMVQQIVDENGILTHVILSPQMPGIPSPPMMGAPNGTGPQMYTPYGQQYHPFPPFVPHHHPMPPRHFHPMGPAHIHHGTSPPPPPNHQCNNSHAHQLPYDSGPGGSVGGPGPNDDRAKKKKVPTATLR